MINEIDQKVREEMERFQAAVDAKINEGFHAGPNKQNVRETLEAILHDVHEHMKVRISVQKVERSGECFKARQSALFLDIFYNTLAEWLDRAAEGLETELAERFTDDELARLTTIEQVREAVGMPPALAKAFNVAKLVGYALEVLCPPIHETFFANWHVSGDDVTPELLSLCHSRQRLKRKQVRIDVSFQKIHIPVQERYIQDHDYLGYDPTGEALRINSFAEHAGRAFGEAELLCFKPMGDALRAGEKFISHDQGRWGLAAEQTAKSAEHGGKGQKITQQRKAADRECQLQFLRVVVRSEQASGRRPIQDLKNLAEHINDPKSAAVLKAAAKEAGTSLGKLPKMETLAGYLVSNRASDKKAWQPIRDNLTAWIEQLKTVRQLR